MFFGLNNLVTKHTNTGDLYEHTVRVNGEDRFLQSVDMIFGKWEKENQSIKLSGQELLTLTITCRK
jgi:hypothetical protein